MLKKIIFWLENSRWYALPMTVLTWLTAFLYGIKQDGNVLYGIIALIGLIFAHLGANLFDDYYEKEVLSDDPAKLECLYVDGYYVFNHKRFAYPAAYKAGLVQRRTAGSWMVTARYMQGNLYNTPDVALESFNMVDGLNTIQASVGGGYSANFVCWHKDPTNIRDKGLRNITINLTALPVIAAFKMTVSNSMHTSALPT